VQRLGAHASLARTEHAHEHLRESVRDARGAIGTCLGSGVECDLAKLVLSAAVRAKSALV
jgi:hypothetical protein